MAATQNLDLDLTKLDERPRKGYTVTYLKDIAGKLGLKKSGNKAELVQRIRNKIESDRNVNRPTENRNRSRTDSIDELPDYIRLIKGDYSNIELKKYLKSVGLSTIGNKDILINRLENYIVDNDLISIEHPDEYLIELESGGITNDDYNNLLNDVYDSLDRTIERCSKLNQLYLDVKRANNENLLIETRVALDECYQKQEKLTKLYDELYHIVN